MSDIDNPRLDGAIDGMISIATPDVAVDTLAGWLVGTLPDGDPDQRMYMMSVALAAALKKLHGVGNRPPTPTKEGESNEQ